MATILRGKTKDIYLELVEQQPLVVLNSEEDYNTAHAFMERLVLKYRLSRGEELYLETLTSLVGDYEDEHYPMGPATDAGLLRLFMDDRGITQAELHRQTQIPKSTISEILSGKKPFTRTIIRKLAEYFGVAKSLFSRNF